MAGLLWLQFGVESLAIVWLACLANEMEKGKRKKGRGQCKDIQNRYRKGTSAWATPNSERVVMTGVRILELIILGHVAFFESFVKFVLSVGFQSGCWELLAIGETWRV